MEIYAFFTKVEENLSAARLCHANGLFNASANRAYYAMLQAAIALLWKKGFEFDPRKHFNHAQIQSLFAGELIHRRKVIAGKFKSYLPDAQTTRGIADYEAVLVSQKRSLGQMTKASEFITALKREIYHA